MKEVLTYYFEVVRILSMDFTINTSTPESRPRLARLQDWATKELFNPALFSLESRKFTSTMGKDGARVADGNHDDVPIALEFNTNAFEKGIITVGKPYQLDGLDFNIAIDAKGIFTAKLSANATSNAKEGGYTIMLLPKGKAHSAMDIKLDPKNLDSFTADISSLPQGEYHPVMISTQDRHLAKTPLVTQGEDTYSKIISFKAGDRSEALRKLAEMLSLKKAS